MIASCMSTVSKPSSTQTSSPSAPALTHYSNFAANTCRGHLKASDVTSQLQAEEQAAGISCSEQAWTATYCAGKDTTEGEEAALVSGGDHLGYIEHERAL